MKLRLGTRSSALALAQSQLVADALVSAALRRGTELDVELVRVTTEGDVTEGPIADVGKSGLFVAALRVALVSGECDLVVHSYKDVPTEAVDGLTVAAIPARADVRDALCGAASLGALPDGARVGTSSLRRAAQVRRANAALETVPLRGNVDTRLQRLADGDYDAIVLAAAGLERLGRADAIDAHLDPAVAVPAPAQGALAVEIRDDAPPDIAELVGELDDRATRLCVTAERAALRALEAGCSAPVGALATLAADYLSLHVQVLSGDGALVLNERARLHASAAEVLGRSAGLALLGRGAARLVASS